MQNQGSFMGIDIEGLPQRIFGVLLLTSGYLFTLLFGLWGLSEVGLTISQGTILPLETLEHRGIINVAFIGLSPLFTTLGSYHTLWHEWAESLIRKPRRKN